MPYLPSSLGQQVSTRQFSLTELVTRAWGSEYFAPDHRVYQFGGVRFFDSTDLGFTGLYGPNQPLSNQTKYTGIGGGSFIFGVSQFGVDHF